MQDVFLELKLEHEVLALERRNTPSREQSPLGKGTTDGWAADFVSGWCRAGPFHPRSFGSDEAKAVAGAVLPWELAAHGFIRAW